MQQAIAIQSIWACKCICICYPVSGVRICSASRLVRLLQLHQIFSARQAALSRGNWKEGQISAFIVFVQCKYETDVALLGK